MKLGHWDWAKIVDFFINRELFSVVYFFLHQSLDYWQNIVTWVSSLLLGYRRSGRQFEEDEVYQQEQQRYNAQQGRLNLATSKDTTLLWK